MKLIDWNDVGDTADSEYLTCQAPEVNAKKRGGLFVLRPEPNQLFIDIDDADALFRFNRAWPLISEEYPGAVHAARSPSGKDGRLHIVVTLRKAVDVPTRLALQSILGSDAKREALGWLRMLRGYGDESVLYSKTEAFGEAIELATVAP